MELGIQSIVRWGGIQRFPGLEWQIAGALLVLLIVYQQLSFYRNGLNIPGPSIVVPFIGSTIPVVRDCTKFWQDQGLMSRKAGISWNVIFGHFFIFVRDSELSQVVFANVKPNGFKLMIDPFGKKLFSEKNFINMVGEEHRDLRKRLAPNFTQRALGTYISIQEGIIRKHIAEWLNLSKSTGGEPMKMRLLIRDLNLETSQQTFVGPYMTEETRKQFCIDYQIFNQGLLAIPLDLPGFAYRKAKLAVQRLLKVLGYCVHESKIRMSNNEAPLCLVDFWMIECVKEIQETEAAGTPPPPHSSDYEVGCIILDFLFAAQDASTCSLAWATVLLESHPQVLKRVREEQQRVRKYDPLAPISPEQLREMEYTTMVVKEVLRFRPPAPMVPHIATSDFPITDTFKAPKGSIVFTSVLESAFQGFSDPHTFDPERFSAARQEDVIYKRNFLVFGAGPHQCVGQRYAINHLTLYVALFSTLVDWTRQRTPGCDDIAYTPSIAPKDDAFVRLSPRVVGTSS